MDVLKTPREVLVKSNIIHDFDEAIVENNLRGCYGKIMARFYDKIIDCYIKGGNAIDCGCGFGLFSSRAIRKGMNVTSIDIDSKSLGIAERIYNIPCRKESIYKTSLSDKSQDAAIFFDVIEHLVIDDLYPELNRLGITQVIVYDSNLQNPFLNVFRYLAGHKEYHECLPSHVAKKFIDGGFRLVSRKYENIISLPISGGLVRKPVPFISRFYGFVYYLDRIIEAIFRFLCIDRFFCFRYLFIFERDKK